MNPPLVVLGLDTGDEPSIRRWLGEGRLPTIGSIVERGIHGRTGGPETVCEYGMGLTLFSGVSRREHGYYYFRQLASGSYDLEAVEPPVSAAPPFWSTLRESGERVLVVDVPDTRPLPGLAGLQLADWATHHGSVNEPASEPPELLDRVRREFGPRVILKGNPAATERENLELRDRVLDRVRRKGELVNALLDDGGFDAIVVFFSETDLASHRFWSYRAEAEGSDPGHPLRHAIRDVYEAVDAEMGRILDRVGTCDAFVVSLYGIRDEYPTSTLIESFLERLGYHVPADGPAPGSPGFDPLAIARRIVPERIRRALSARLPATAQEELLARRLREGTDWGRTTAFAVPSLFTSFVRVNLRGREPEGIVAPGAEYRDLLDRIEADLRVLVDADTGEPAVAGVHRSVDLFGEDPPDHLPDLFVEWVPGPKMLTRVRHPRATLVQARPAYCPDSQERLSGFVAGAGPSIAGRGDVGEIDLLDLAPTFLAALGRPAPASMEGRVVPWLSG